jgi:hypothetical protein
MILKLFNYMTTTKYLGNIERNDKYLLVFSNLIFVYIFYILYKQNKISKRTYLLIFIFLISSFYHFNQCHNHNNNMVDLCVLMDFFTCVIIGFILLFCNYNKVNLKVILLLILSFFLLDRYKYNTEYIYCHSLWHIFMGITLYLLLK